MKIRREAMIIKLTISALSEENNIIGANIANPKRNEVTETKVTCKEI